MTDILSTVKPATTLKGFITCSIDFLVLQSFFLESVFKFSNCYNVEIS